MEYKMTNPRYVPVSKDDTMWFYDTSTTDTGPFLDPAQWYFDTIYRSGQCDKPKGPFQVIRAKYESGDRKVQFTGVCGTGLILASGFAGPVMEDFLRWRASRAFSRTIEATEWHAFLHETQHSVAAPPALLKEAAYSRLTAANFWTTCEATLDAQPGRNGDIEFLFFEEEMQMYVHLELGSNQKFKTDFYNALSEATPFRDWLLKAGLVDRTLWSVDSNGNKTPLTSFKLGDITLDVSDFETPLLGAVPPCPEGFCYAACSLLAGTITNYDPDNGVVDVGLEVVAIKTYCDDAMGQPCP